MELNDVKLFLRVDGNNEDILINDLIKTAHSYMAGAVDNFDEKYQNADDRWKAKADQAMRLLIADWYENRLAVGRPEMSAVALLITQLQL